MHSFMALAIMLLPFSAFLLVIGGRALRTANKQEPFRPNVQRDIATKVRVNPSLTLEQFEVIADALEFTGQCIEKEITDTAEGSEKYALLLADREEVSRTMEAVANRMRMDSLVAPSKPNT